MCFYEHTKGEGLHLEKNVLLLSFFCALEGLCGIHQRIKNWVSNTGGEKKSRKTEWIKATSQPSRKSLLKRPVWEAAFKVGFCVDGQHSAIPSCHVQLYRIKATRNSCVRSHFWLSPSSSRESWKECIIFCSTSGLKKGRRITRNKKCVLN